MSIRRESFLDNIYTQCEVDKIKYGGIQGEFAILWVNGTTKDGEPTLGTDEIVKLE